MSKKSIQINGKRVHILSIIMIHIFRCAVKYKIIIEVSSDTGQGTLSLLETGHKVISGVVTTKH